MSGLMILLCVIGNVIERLLIIVIGLIDYHGGSTGTYNREISSIGTLLLLIANKKPENSCSCR